jgi:hypothetical protein
MDDREAQPAAEVPHVLGWLTTKEEPDVLGDVLGLAPENVASEGSDVEAVLRREVGGGQSGRALAMALSTDASRGRRS